MEPKTLEQRKRDEFRKLMECKWSNGKPIEWMLDEEVLNEADNFLMWLMAEIRQNERNYIIKRYNIQGFK